MSQFENEDGGAFWRATDRNSGEPKMTKGGKPYWTGSVTVDGVKRAACLFFTRPEDKKNERQPDFSVSFMEARQDVPAAQPSKAPERNAELEALGF